MTSIIGNIIESTKFIIRLLRHCFRFDKYMRASYSQEGEDLILSRIFGEQKTGFYIDIGAHHPKRFSNTYFFYCLGWSGINIDAMPGSMKEFNKVRPRDINVEVPILKERQKLNYYQFSEPALNGFSVSLSKDRELKGYGKIINIIELEGVPLKSILLEQMPSNVNQIDFMSVDVEGLDLEVLQSNDWILFRPKVLLVELLSSSLDSIENDPVFLYLKEQKYFIYAKAVQTVFFMSAEYMIECGIRHKLS